MTEGDIRLGDTLDLDFTTSVGGVPTQLAGSPAVAAYVGNSTTEITAGITLTVDFDGRTGLNHVRVVATSGNGFATATNIRLVITAGTVGGQSVVGSVIGSFSIENRSALIPTVASRTLDVSAGGEAGLDWANVGSPTTAVDLSGTTIKTTQKVDVDTIKTQAVTLAGGVTIPAATLASTTNITAGTVTTASNLTTNNDKTGYGLSAAAVQAIWDALTSALTTAGSIGKRIGDFLTGDAYVRLGAAGAGLTALGDARIANLDATVSSRTKPSDTQARVTLVDTLTTYTGNTPQTGDSYARIGAAGASLTDLGGMSTAMKAQVQQEAEDALAVTIADSVPADGSRPSPNQALYAIYQFLMERAVSGTTLTVKKPDGSTTLMTFTLSDPTSPISITRTS